LRHWHSTERDGPGDTQWKRDPRGTPQSCPPWCTQRHSSPPVGSRSGRASCTAVARRVVAWDLQVRSADSRRWNHWAWYGQRDRGYAPSPISLDLEVRVKDGKGVSGDFNPVRQTGDTLRFLLEVKPTGTVELTRQVLAQFEAHRLPKFSAVFNADVISGSGAESAAGGRSCTLHLTRVGP
jgi:hypothetical protein